MGESTWVIVGADGQLGRELTRVMQRQGAVDCCTLGRADLDIRDRPEVREVVGALDPAVVINVAAWNSVDEAEDVEVAAYAVNAMGPENLAIACAEVGASLIHVSTDYVFGGARPGRTPWDEGDPPDPRCAYGRTKLAGEHAVLHHLPSQGYVVRTAWLYSEFRSNFALTMLSRARAGLGVRVVNDQWGQPTWASDLAGQLVELGQRAVSGGAPPGTYHGTNSGDTTWWEFARAIYSLCGADPDLVAAITSADLQRPATRPEWSVLGHQRWASADLRPMRPWYEALAEAIPTLQRACMTIA